MKNIHSAFWGLTLGTIIILLLPRVLMDGMFTDGVLYASIAHNLAIGKGSFWYPYFDKFLFPFFQQQPPLTLGIQALFFKFFGESIYVERFYSFATAIISAFLINIIWRGIYNNSSYKIYSWLPVLLWIIMPECIWAYSNNMEENTMGIFTLLSVLFIYKSLITQKKYMPYLILGSLFIVPAALCKGIQGMFPIAMSFIYVLIIKPKFSATRLVSTSITPLFINVIIFAVLIKTHPSLTAYLNDRVLRSIEQVSNVDSRFYLIEQLFITQLIVPVILAIIILLIAGRSSFRFKELNNVARRNIIFWFLIGVSASFPLIITREQRLFYLVTSFPYFAIAIALVVVPYINKLMQKITTTSISFKIFSTLTIAYIVIGLSYSYFCFGKTGRDKEKLQDVYSIGKLIGHDADIEVSSKTWCEDWGLHNYFVRHFNISLAWNDSTNCNYYLVSKLNNEYPPKNYRVIIFKGEMFDLYSKK